LDQKYNKHTRLGLSWAGHVSVKDSYSWDPGRYLRGGNSSAVVGVEAPLWTETINNLHGIQFMAFPRLPAAAELGWSPPSAHNWGRFVDRLGRQAPRWRAMGIHFYRAPAIPWS
jgi:hexosaminidase